jgi:biopolymer transport protein ExbD
MAFAAANTRDTQMASMNITPLVDVMLVLLVIFMIAMPAVSQTLPIALPGESTGKPVDHQTLRLDIGAGDVYALDGVAVGRSELARRFDSAVRSTRLPLVVEIRTHPDAEYQTVAQGLSIARNAGIDSLTFVER